MLIVTVYVHVKENCIDDFIAATNENAAASREEPGVARFDVIRNLESPNQFLLIEAYRDDSAPAAHKETAHYKKWRETVESMMAEPRSNKKYSEVSPAPSDW